MVDSWIENLALQSRAQTRQFGFGPLCLKFGVVRRLLEFRAGQFQNHRVGFHLRARPNDNFFHAAFGVCRNPANLFRHERAQSAHLAHHRSALHRIDPNRRAIHARHGRLETRQSKRREQNRNRSSRDNHDAALFLFRGHAFARNIHGRKARCKASWSHDG